MGRKQRGRYRKTRRISSKSTGRRPNTAKKEKKLKNINIDETNSYLIKLEEKAGDVTIQVECGANKADLYISKLCQGSKGQCIYFRESWLTPNEYQFISGRESAKDWKRSIKHDGKSLKMLYEKGIFRIHKASCGCNGGRTLTSCFRRTEENDSLIPTLSGENTEASRNEVDKELDENADGKESDIETDAERDDKCNTKEKNEEDGQSALQKDDLDSNDENISSDEESSELDKGKDVDLNHSPEDENDLKPSGGTVAENDVILMTDPKRQSEETIQYIPLKDREQSSAIPLQNDVHADKTCTHDKQADILSSVDKVSNVFLLDEKLPDYISENRTESVHKTSECETETLNDHVSEKESVIGSIHEKTNDSLEVKKTCVTSSTEHIRDHTTCEKEMDHSVESSWEAVESIVNACDKEAIIPIDEKLPDCIEIKPAIRCTLDNDLQTISKEQYEETSSSVSVEAVQQEERSGNDNELSKPSTDGSPIHANNCFLKKRYKNSQSPPGESKLSSIINQLRSAKEKELTETVTSTPVVSKKESTGIGAQGTRKTKKDECKEGPPSTVSPPRGATQRVTPSTVCVHEQDAKSNDPVKQCGLPSRQKIHLDSQSEKTTKFFNNKCNDSGRMSPVTGRTAEDIPDYKGPGGNLSYDDYMKALAGMKPQLPFPPVSVEQFALQKNRKIFPSGKKPESAQILVNNLIKEKPPSVLKQEAMFSSAMHPHLLGAHLAFPWQTMPFLGLNPFLPLQHDFFDALTKAQPSSKQPEVDKKHEKSLKRQNQCDETALDLSNKKPKLDKTLNSKTSKGRVNCRTTNCGESNSTVHCSKARKYSLVGHVKDTSVKYSQSVNDGRAKDSVSSWINHSSVNKSTECTCKYNSKADMINWDVDDVCQFVKSIPGCTQYVKKFHDHKVNGQCLPLLTTEQLTKCLKMTIGPALILTHSVARKISETRKLIKCEHCRPRDGLTVKTAI